MVFFRVGIFCTYLLALFSSPRLREEALGPPLWRTFRMIELEYIAVVFAADFIVGPLQAGLSKHPLTYIPSVLMLWAEQACASSHIWIENQHICANIFL
jgi:hypothetical protein